MMLITDFKSYIEELKEIEKRKEQIIKDLESSLRITIESEFSKHLKSIEYKNEKIFLIDDDFGIRISKANYDQYYNCVGLNINTVYKIGSDRWQSNFEINTANYKTDYEIPINDFVENYIRRIKNYNIKRVLEKNKRALKKDLKKYNI